VESFTPRPLVIVGAPRSGTNALRDALCRLPGFHTWPCDELNPLWRTRNRNLPTDELTPGDARPEVTTTIRRAFAARQRVNPAAQVVEKTCANSLRLGFVHAVIPEACYVEIVRDGRDAASSAVERWGASLDLGYTLRKLRFVPPGDLAAVAATSLRQRLQRSRPTEAAISTWGPRWEGMDAMLARNATLEAVSAAQWRACVEGAERFFAENQDVQVLRLRYEDFVTDPASTLRAICAFSESAASQAEIAAATEGIHAKSVGRWKRTLLADDTEALEILAPGLSARGYANAC